MSNSADLAQQIQQFLPKYLSPAQKDQLWAELASFPENFPYYFHNPALQDDLLQGDGWRGFIAVHFASGERRTVSGVILSNTCDISPDNQRVLPVNIVFSPLIALDKYIGLLRSHGRTTVQIDSLVRDIKRQRLTSMFYFPSDGNNGEFIILFDNIYIHPLANFLEQTSKASIFKLSQTAFYLFLMKLSIHFSRFQEGIVRFPAST